MKKFDKPTLSIDPWQQLKGFTRARIALGRAGSSLPTKELLDFTLSHAMARDAVHLALNVAALAQDLEEQGFSIQLVHSKAPDRTSYLLRPDYGRQLDQQSRRQLQAIKLATAFDSVNLVIVVGDGLSSLAVERHAKPLLTEIKKNIPEQWKLGSIVIASQARVALADEIGELLGADIVIMLIGERPGLRSPDSLSIYMTYAPRVGCSDADRNCISNICSEGLPYETAAKKLIWLAKEAIRRKLSGVALKDESSVQEIAVTDQLKKLLKPE
ncbi:ethanolamine ammonia-lyase subunit EutC [Nitrosomonas sp. Is37]|uniref:ethanolamine ammonia-lyase subunit EutC n=1 Tax=Nitrosomonas sp. Is37 TaxID=3080535 RepID=UPI00294B0D37|nr:ethanolamine ammonia-lyase subunit EutC [Nitrosomonas sp. Is37]MDV6345280.1 ethanolamine ammonia-lyase subunit EutC [Nitrosomonas sp. Is37]